MKGPKYPVSATNTSIDIIETLEEQGGLGITELSECQGIAKSTVHKHLSTLESRGYVVKKKKRYHLSYRFLEIGGNFRAQHGIYNAVKSEADKLVSNIGHTVGVGVEESGHRIIIYRSEGDGALNTQDPVGSRTLMHWTATGKVLLSGMNKFEQKEILNEHGTPRATNKTLVNIEEIMTHLKKIQNQGYAIEDEERKRGMRCIAVPVNDSDNNVVAAIGIAMPSKELDKWKAAKIIKLLNKYSNRISIRHEYHV
ncbi:IclR family transcriptional regulator [Natrialba sp. INN-245]|uniref:IclR family transcriptional regulator n=1 Tax=Natrialba sp. INN-245 TaxID=2690967 RepID=UPI0013103CCD|nr:IclR family transcriptional regulator [Natrialba sp. INN-245]MWV38846.1 helix-turn-helix domain-containing protein [Natrialba sp. INN-245]